MKHLEKRTMIKEFIELQEKVDELKDFIYSENPEFKQLSESHKQLLEGQFKAMMKYSDELRERLDLIGVTQKDIEDYKHPYRYMSFGEAIEFLKAGKCVRRESWVGDKFVVKQVDSDIPDTIVPNMQSLPDSAKKLIGKTAEGGIHYRCQCLLIKQYPSTSCAINYVPDWSDIFANDWMAL